MPVCAAVPSSCVYFHSQFLKSCITLGEDSADLFVQSPLPAFDLYMTQLRAGTVRQTASQCNEDDQCQETQTEPVTLASVGMQFPDDIGVGGSGGAKSAFPTRHVVNGAHRCVVMLS